MDDLRRKAIVMAYRPGTGLILSGLALVGVAAAIDNYALIYAILGAFVGYVLFTWALKGSGE